MDSAEGIVKPLGNQKMKIINATQIEIELSATPTTPINGAVNPAVVKIQWGESFCNFDDTCGNNQAYSDFYYGDKE